MSGTLSSLRLIRLAAGGVAAVLAAPAAALASRVQAPRVVALSVRNRRPAYHGQRALFATVSPGVPGRDTATVAVQLDRPGTVHLEAVRTALRRQTVVWETRRPLAAGRHVLSWKPAPGTPVGSYVMRLTVEGPAGVRRTVGARRPASPDRAKAPVVRVLGVEAAFTRRSYAPGERAVLRIAADARRLTLQFLACGAEPEPTNRIDELRGIPVGDPVTFDWSGKRFAPNAVVVQPGEWPSGVYAARLETDDGRVGFAPLILRPTVLGATREAVIQPTNTWQAYNFADPDGDGWGDTWYAGGNPPVRLDRPYRERGVPPYFRRYDLAFLKWLKWTHRTPDMLCDDDLEAFPSGDELRRLYDLVVFPGHSEYMTEHAYDVVERFRDLGGRLIFLSANNFFWRVDRVGNELRRIKLWRELGRPESRLLGVQYRANDDGRRQGSFVVTGAEECPWLYEGTGLVNGSLLGEMVGGYGIEIDASTRHTPPGTKVLGVIPDLFGPGVNAEMTYYETPVGARVFSAGALDFGGSATFWPVRRLLENLWRHMRS